MKRTGRRVALLAWYPPDNPALPPFIPNMGMYMVAAAVAAANLDGLDLRIWDERTRSPAEVAQEIAAFDPDVIGGSAFLWSLPALQETLVPVLEDDPTRLLVLGGPSARPNMLALAPFARLARQVDVLREVLLGLLADDPTLEPRDILVMCPDIETYAPLIAETAREALTETL